MPERRVGAKASVEGDRRNLIVEHNLRHKPPLPMPQMLNLNEPAKMEKNGYLLDLLAEPITMLAGATILNAQLVRMADAPYFYDS